MYHALGFYHEQSRTDRNDYVQINWENIEDGYAGNFLRYPASVIDPFGEEYDYGSVMHYSSTGFSVNGEETITPLASHITRLFPFISRETISISISQDPEAEIGQRIGLSDTDLAKLLNMYNC